MTITVISSMATRLLLSGLARSFEQQHAAWKVDIASMGGVDAARLVRGGQVTDVVVLASTVMEQLENEGLIVAGSRAGVVRSGMAIAVRAGRPWPAIASEADVLAAVLAAETICYSTGPSGDHLKRLFERWTIVDRVTDRMVEAKPGVPVGELLARGEADLGFQQLSELLGIDGAEVVGPLPPEIQAVTVFTAGVSSQAVHADGARAFIAYLLSPETRAAKEKLGLEAAG